MVVAFTYSQSGTSTDDIYSYMVGMDEDNHETMVHYELNCGYETYTLPADAELLQALTVLAADYNLHEWDGFHKTNSHVLDGSGFDLQIGFADGTGVSASGSNRFPEKYSDASHAIDELFLSYLEKQGVVREGGL